MKSGALLLGLAKSIYYKEYRSIRHGISINKSTHLANAFNEHFSTVGPKLANQIPSAANGDKSCLEYLNITDQRFCFTPTNSSQVLLLLNKLSKSKATGLDKISA